MEIVLVSREAAAGPLGPPTRSDVSFHPDDRLDVDRLGLAKELDGAMEIAMIRDRDRGHPEGLGPLD